MISLIIPCYNEEKRLSGSLKKLEDFLHSFAEDLEVLIVDDGSLDETVSLALSQAKNFKKFKVVQLTKHQGKGAAVNQGFKQATGEIVVFTDADFSTPITEIGKLLEKISNGYDIAVGSRALDRSVVKKHQNFFREIMGRSFNLLVQTFAVSGIKDTQCGFKAFAKNSCVKIFEKQAIFDFGFDVELLFLAKKFGLKIAEVPVIWYNDERSSVSPFADSIKTFYDLIKIRFIHAKEKFSS